MASRRFLCAAMENHTHVRIGLPKVYSTEYY
jgi:hypothetical protein